MGRPSCCKPRSQAPGVAAVALIIGAGLAADKIGPHVPGSRMSSIDVLRTVAVTDADHRRGRHRGLGDRRSGPLVAWPTKDA